MDTNSLENALNPNDSEATYRALRDSILQIYQFGTKIAKEANSDNELQVSWELGDTSLMNWISDTHCYLSRKGQKLQFLARPSKLEIISFDLDEGDKLLICSDSLRQNLSDNEIDEILQESHGSESSCQNLLKIANVNHGATENTHNIVVMEVINNQRVITPTPIAENKKLENSSSKFNPLWVVLPLLLLALGGGLSWLWKSNKFDLSNLVGGNRDNVALEDTLKFINKDSLELVKANDSITKEFETGQQTQLSPEIKDDFAKAPVKEFKNDNQTSKSNNSTNSTDKTSRRKSSTENNNLDFPDKSTTSNSAKGNSFDSVKEEENYNALLQQKERWMIIKNDLESTLNSGNNAAAEKLKNSEKVIGRIEEKLKESAKKLGKN
jgi:hypothetical protein